MGGDNSEPWWQSQPKRKRTPARASSSREAGGGQTDDFEDADAGENPVEEGLFSVGLADTSVLDCPLCFEPLTLPVFQCVNGHILCSSCCESVKQKCPSCSRKIGSSRCRAIESVLESIEVPCTYKTEGCPLIFSYSSKRSHEMACPYAPFACPFISCSFVGCKKGLSLHINDEHASSIVRLRFDHVCVTSMSRSQGFVVFREEVNGTLFILSKYDRMAVSCIDGSDVAVGDRLEYAVVVRGKDSCVRFQSVTCRFENTPAGKGVTVARPSKDFIQVPSYLFNYHGCLRVELLIWSKGKTSVDIAKGGIGDPH